jgi:hypothetical protein
MNTPPTLTIICTTCGLPNIPERRICQRCRALLTPSDQERRQMVVLARQNRRVWLRLLPIGILWAILGITFVIRVFNNEPWMPTPGGAIDIRANGVAILRLATKTPPEEVAVYDDGLVSRFTRPIQSNHEASINLTLAEQAEFTQFRNQWCQQMPTFRPLAPTEAFYDLGIRCAGYEVKQAKVPVEALPAFFAKLLQRLPLSAS